MRLKYKIILIIFLIFMLYIAIAMFLSVYDMPKRIKIIEESEELNFSNIKVVK